MVQENSGRRGKESSKLIYVRSLSVRMLLCGVDLRGVRCVRWKELSAGHQLKEGGVNAADTSNGALGILQVRIWAMGEYLL